MMAAGLVVVAHESAGPKFDIVRPSLPYPTAGCDQKDKRGEASGPAVHDRSPNGFTSGSTNGSSNGSPDGVGYLANDEQSFADAIADAFALPYQSRCEVEPS
jgi:hypothetical protein